MDTLKQPTTSASGKPDSFRWMQLVFGVVCMCMIANMQYGWTFFVNPMQEKHGAGTSLAGRQPCPDDAPRLARKGDGLRTKTGWRAADPTARRSR